MSLPYKTGQSGSERIWNSTVYGAGFGTLVGTVRGAWESVWVPAVWASQERDRGRGLGRALTVMGANALTFGGIAFVYSAVEATMETTRGEADWKNGAIAGLAAGSVVGLKTGSLGAAVSSGVAFCAASVFVDATSGQSRANPFTGDGGTTNPYHTSLGGLNARRF